MESGSTKDKSERLQSHFTYVSDGIKRCYLCKKLLPESEFHKNKNRYRGYTNECKTCASLRYKKAYKGIRRLKIQYQAVERRSRRTNLPFHITFEEFRKWDDKFGEADSRICPYCGLTEKESKDFQRIRGKKKLCGFAVDRIDNEKGYTIDNIQRICYICNSIRGLWFTIREMKKLGPHIRKIQKKALDKTRFPTL